MPSARRRIRLTFVATGESVVAEMLDDEAPQTCQLIWDQLPVEQGTLHGQFSGAEIFLLMDTPKPAPAENRTQLPMPGEILYWSETGTSVTGGGNTVAEICVIYSRGVVLRGPEGVPSHGSLFARIPGDWKYDWTKFADACRRVRREGSQRLRIERMER